MSTTAARAKSAKECGDEHVLRGREPLQMGWYELASTLVEGQTVLDVGCGSGEGLKLLQKRARSALGIDRDPRLARDDIRICDLEDLPDKSFDAVVCIDVIEHVEDDHGFVRQLARVARNLVFVSTPNFSVGHNRHPYHVYFINRLYTFAPTVLLAKVLRRLLFTRLWAHNAVVVQIAQSGGTPN